MTKSAKKTDVGQALSPLEHFEIQLHEMDGAIEDLLPKHISKARFMTSAITAATQNPDLLKCKALSLFGAIKKSAQDGLLPDGREGVITPFKGEASWNPMTYGLRKRARELDGIIIDAQVVHENDQFLLHQGDDPRIEHTPAPLGQARGTMVGAYAIFRQGDEILHREVMDKKGIEDVHGQANAKNSLMWSKFTGEAWRKTVVRRGIKTVPCSERLETVIRRDDEFFDFDDGPVDVTPISPPDPPDEEDEAARPVIIEDAEEVVEMFDDKVYLDELEAALSGWLRVCRNERAKGR